MELTIKYFGILAEITQCDTETMVFEGDSILELLEKLHLQYPLLSEKEFQVAQNQKLVSKNDKITHNQIALLPPFAGG